MKKLLAAIIILSSVASAAYYNQQPVLMDSGISTLSISDNNATTATDPFIAICGRTGTDRCAFSVVETPVPPSFVNTTSSTSISAGTRTITVGSTVGMHVGFRAVVDTGGSQETVELTDVTSTTITGPFVNSHSGTYAVVGTKYAACNDPCTSVSVDRNLGNTYYIAEVVDSSGNPKSPRVLSGMQVIPQVAITHTAGNWKFPIEVVGQPGYTTYVQDTALSGLTTTNMRLVMVINNPGYQAQNPVDGKCSFNINGGSWISISNANAVGMDEGIYYGSQATSPNIGNPVTTRVLTFAISDGTITAGATNTFGFRFNDTDGVGSGCRILDLNVIQATVQADSMPISGGTGTVTTHSAHGYSSSDWVYQFYFPGAIGVSNGLRQITVTNSTHYTYTACTTIDFLSCASTGVSSTVPTSRTDADPTYWGLTQPVAYTARAFFSTMAAQEDPSTWTDGGWDASAGQTLWETAALVVPKMGWRDNISRATCGSCHMKDGSDLKAFNYSNHSIIVRAMFHGLTKDQGQKIAAYIRDLSTSASASTTIGRPYNPLYQPGTGLDSHSVYEWAAGAGRNAVLMYDNDSPICTPDSTWVPTSYVNQREVPIHIHLQDWNHWLPPIWMGDFFEGGSTDFTNSNLFSYYNSAWTDITAGDDASFHSYDDYMEGFFSTQFRSGWYATVNNLGLGAESAQAGVRRPSQYNLALFSAKLWVFIKNVEIIRLKGFEGTLATQYTTLYGSSTNGYMDRGGQWQIAFQAAPHFQIAISQYGIYDETGDSWTYLSAATYALQIIFNNGNRRANAGITNDWGYVFLYNVEALGDRRANGCMAETAVPISGIQASYDWPNIAENNGLNYQVLRPQVTPYGNGQSQRGQQFLSDSQRAAIATQWVTNWLTVYTKYGNAAFQAVYDIEKVVWISNCCDPAHGIFGNGTTLDGIAYILPIFKTYGVSTTLLGDLADAANAIFPGRDFRAIDLAATCTWSGGTALAQYTCTNLP